MAARLLRNIWLKISALLLAMLTWWGVHNSMETTDDFIYNVRLLLPGNIKVKQISPEIFSITVSGPNEAVKAFRTAKHEYVIDLSASKGSEKIVRTINREKIELPSSLSIDNISNQEITIILDALIQKDLVVECDVTDKPAPGYAVVRKFARPSHISRELPLEDAKSITSIKTAPISVSAATTSVLDRIALVDPLIPGRRIDVFVDITIVIEPELVEKEFKDVPVLVLKRPDDKREIVLDASKISVTLRGRRDIMETFDKTKLKVYLDITKQDVGEYDLEPLVQPIEGISFIKPELIKYTIKP